MTTLMATTLVSIITALLTAYITTRIQLRGTRSISQEQMRFERYIPILQNLITTHHSLQIALGIDNLKDLKEISQAVMRERINKSFSAVQRACGELIDQRVTVMLIASTATYDNYKNYVSLIKGLSLFSLSDGVGSDLDWRDILLNREPTLLSNLFRSLRKDIGSLESIDDDFFEKLWTTEILVLASDDPMITKSSPKPSRKSPWKKS